MNTPIHDELVRDVTEALREGKMITLVGGGGGGGVVYVDNLTGLWGDLKSYVVAKRLTEGQSRHGRIKHIRDERRRIMKKRVRLMAWGDIGEEYRPDKCTHGPDDGCMWCCQRCNRDTHFCPGCGTVAGHNEVACPDCK